MDAETAPHRVLIAGIATRALAASAVRAGYRVTAVDAFGDLDLRSVADVVMLSGNPGRRYTPATAAAAVQTLAIESVAYTSNFENYPAAVRKLAEGRQLLGNSPAVLLRVRDPLSLMRVLRNAGFSTPHTRATRLPARHKAGSWLMKPRRSGGGHGTTVWRPGQAVPRTHYIQERIDGVAASVVFAADGRRAVPLGLSQQLVGDRHFGSSGFRYCGSLLGDPAALFPAARELFEAARRLADVVTLEYGLIGLNGIDFINGHGVPYPIEVNPRYSASMELVERAHGLPLFELHVRACRGELPAPVPIVPGVEGKAIVFARSDISIGNTRGWLEHGWLADIPVPGERIRRGHPICTVFAHGRDAGTCYKLLMKRASKVYQAVGSRKRRAA